MRTSLKSFLLIVAFFSFFSSYAANYTWTGSTNTNWSTATNWSPNGVPGVNDTAKVVSVANAPVLQSNITVKRFTMQTGTLNLNSNTLTVSNEGYFIAGTISSGTLILRGLIASFTGANFSGPINAINERIVFSGGTFSDTCYFEINGLTRSDGLGGCIFNAAVTIKKTGNVYFNMGKNNPDTFNAPVKFINTATYAMQIGYNSVCNFNDSLSVESTNAGGISFSAGSNSGGAILASGKKIGIGAGGFTNGILTLKNFVQQGNSTQNLTATGSAIFSLVNATFNGKLTINSPGILLKSSVFNDSTEFIRSANSSSYCDGGNTFNGAVTFRNNATNSASFRLAVQAADVFNSNVTFITSTGYIQAAYSGINEFKGNVSINSAYIVFNVGPGKVLCTGTANQTFSATGSISLVVSKLGINKSSGGVTFSSPISVDSLLELTSGNIITSSTNLLTLKAAATVSGGSLTSFVNGPVKKIGNTAFTFPIGSNGNFRPVSISAPATANAAIFAEFISNFNGITTDCNLDSFYVFGCDYWNIVQMYGQSNLNLNFHWDSLFCGKNAYDRLFISRLINNKWTGVPSNTPIGTSQGGSVSTTNLSNQMGLFTFSALNCYNDGTILVGTVPTQTFSYGLGTPVPPINICPGTFITFTVDPIIITGCLNPIGFAYYSLTDPFANSTLFQVFGNLAGPGFVTFTLTIPGIYYVKTKLNLTTVPLTLSQVLAQANETFTIIVSPPATPILVNAQSNPIGAVLNLCTGQSQTICADQVYASYLWSTGATSQCINVSNPGLYQLTVTSQGGCPGSVNTQVNVIQLSVALSIQNPCGTSQTGTVNGTLTNGTGPYTITWQQTPSGANGSIVSSNTTFSIVNLAAGNYNLSIVDGNGCTTQTSFSIINYTGSISILNNTSTTICSGGTVQLTAIGNTSPGVYSWTSSGIGTFSCINCQTTIFTPNASQIVNILFTSNNGCVSTNTLAVVVNSLPLPPVISAPLTNCEANSIAEVSNVIATMNYRFEVWSNGSVIYQNIGSNLSVLTAWQTPFTIKFFVTDPITGCSNNSSVIVYGCCEGSNYLGNVKMDLSNQTWGNVIANPAWSPFVSYNPIFSMEALTSTIGGVRYVIAINGTFVIDQNMDLAFATFVMGPMAKIIVNPGVRFLIGEGNFIHSCGQYMWDGIITTNSAGFNPSYVDFYTGNSIVEDAINAVQINAPSHLFTYKATFNKNWTSIQFNGQVGNPSKDIFQTNLQGSVFTSMTSFSLLSDEPIYLPPHKNMIPAAGIEINNVEELANQKLEIGFSGEPGKPDPQGLTNMFSNMNYGIRVNNSSVDVHNNSFFSIRSQPIIGLARGQGACVQINNAIYPGTVTVGNANSSSIYSSGGGIAAFSKLYCNSFESSTFGVVANNSKGSLTVANNSDPLLNTGLSYQYPKSYTFNFNKVHTFGVNTTNCKEIKLKIRNNNFENCNVAINTASTAVRVGASYSISNNTINITSRNFYTPIPIPMFRGIVMSQLSPHSQISADITNNICTGLFNTSYALNSVNNVNFIGNETHLLPIGGNTNVRGLWMMGTINCTILGNIFTTAPSQSSWFANSTGIFIDACGYNSVIENSFHKLQNHIEVFNSMTGTNFECNKFNEGLNGLIINGSYVGDQGSLGAAQNNDWDLSLNTTVNIWGKGNYLQSDWYVHSVSPGTLPDPITQVPTLPTPFAPAPLIFNATQNTMCGQDPCPGCRVSKLFAVTDFLNTIDTTHFFEQKMAGLTQSIDEAIEDSIFLQQIDQNAITLKNVLITDSTTSRFFSLQVALKELLQIDSIRSSLTPVVASNNIQLINTYSILEVLIRYIHGEMLTVEDSSLLVNMASSNAYYDGFATFIARGLCEEWGEDFILNSLRVTSNKTIDVPKIKVVPNPTLGKILVTVPSFTRELYLYNVYGQLLRNINTNNLLSFEVDISDQPDGIYFLKCNDQNSSVKFVKIH